MTKTCVKCGAREGEHQVGTRALCCECYVRAGHAPEEQHPVCMETAMALLRSTRRRG